MKPHGRTPAEVAKLDDQVFDLDCLAEAQVENTGSMLGHFAAICGDGRLDDEDLPEFASLLRRTRLEHRWNAEQSAGMKQVRRMLNPLFEIVKRLRGRLEATKAELEVHKARLQVMESQAVGR